jgi:hypothetical protein
MAVRVTLFSDASSTTWYPPSMKIVSPTSKGCTTKSVRQDSKTVRMELPKMKEKPRMPLDMVIHMLSSENCGGRGLRGCNTQITGEKVKEKPRVPLLTVIHMLSSKNCGEGRGTSGYMVPSTVCRLWVW